MKDRCATDFKLFCEHYLSDSFRSPWSEFHLWLIKKIESVVLDHATEETKDVTAAPRGHAKSTLTSFAMPIWCAVYGYRKFIVIISATSPVAKQFITDIRNELEFNEKIVNDFGIQKNVDIWNSSEIYTRKHIFITSKGAGAQLRGMKFNSTRPQLVILDDLETPEDADSPTACEHVASWFNSDVMPMGAPDCSFFMIGTVLSYNCLLYHMLNDPQYSSWTRKTFQAVISFSRNPLWEEWEDIMVDLERGDSAASDARKFYEEHREEMLEGTKVLWPEQRKDMYLHLMTRRLESPEGFQSEYMNDPQTEATRVFKEEWLKNNLYIDHPEIRSICIGIDPAVVGKRRSDYSVIVVVAQCANNYFYVLECDAQKRRAEEIVDAAKEIIGKYYKYRPKIVVETNVMQTFFSNTLQQEFVKSGIYLEWIEVAPHGAKENKARRIESLAPHIRQGHIKFKEGQRILLSQLKNYPKGHDDAPDALEMAIRPLFKTSAVNFSFGSVNGTTKKQRDWDAMKKKVFREWG
nr:MAG TPA: Large Terminase [Caudoviricetes sp.]